MNLLGSVPETGLTIKDTEVKKPDLIHGFEI